MAVAHAEAGADIVAPSDMMDGRIRAMREALERQGLATPASSATPSSTPAPTTAPSARPPTPRPSSATGAATRWTRANAREGLRDALLDLEEGADALMVKPALPNLDLIWRLREQALCPIAAYHISSKYSTVKAAARLGWVDEANLFREHLLAIRRAGADWIVTYAAREALQKHWI